MTAGCWCLTGAGEAFCSGLDLSALQDMQDKSAAEHRADAERIARLFLALYELPMPTVAAVHGAAIAGGAGLAMICDFTLATPAAKFGFTEVRIGFVPALVSAFLALQIGEKRSRDLLLTGRLFDAGEAHRFGLVNEVVRARRLAARVRRWLKCSIANSPESLESDQATPWRRRIIRGWMLQLLKRLKPTRFLGRRRIFAKGLPHFLKNGSRSGERRSRAKSTRQ